MRLTNHGGSANMERKRLIYPRNFLQISNLSPIPKWNKMVKSTKSLELNASPQKCSFYVSLAWNL